MTIYQAAMRKIGDPMEASFFQLEKRKRKQTKRQKLKEKRTKRRRLSHKLRIVKCGCKKKCDQIFSKDERVNIHSRFWKLEPNEQCNFIRENVHRSSVQTRRTNRTVANHPKKNFSYTFNLSLINGEKLKVCRKFFLAVIGYGENCG